MKPCHASYDRFLKIKEKYSYIFGVRQFCARIELTTDPQDDLDVYYCNGIIATNFNSKLPEYRRHMIEQVISFSQILHSKFRFNPDLEWLFVVAGNLAIKSSYNKRAVEIFTDVGKYDVGCDPSVLEVLLDIQDILLEFAQDANINLLCRWLDSMLRQMEFCRDGRTVQWLGIGQEVMAATRTPSDFVKLQQAMNFITSVRYDNHSILLFNDDQPTETEIVMSTDIDWLCDMAFHVLALLPAIDDKLSCLLTGSCEQLADKHLVWCKRENLNIIDADDIHRSVFAPESSMVN